MLLMESFGYIVLGIVGVYASFRFGGLVLTIVKNAFDFVKDNLS